MPNPIGRAFAPFRIPSKWNEEERSLVRQIQDLFDRLFRERDAVSKSAISLSRTGTNGTYTYTCNKVGHIVTFSARIHSMTTNNTANGEFFCLPEGYRPKVATELIGSAYIGSNFVAALWMVGVDGKVSLMYSNNATTTQVYVAGTFPV